MGGPQGEAREVRLACMRGTPLTFLFGQGAIWVDLVEEPIEKPLPGLGGQLP